MSNSGANITGAIIAANPMGSKVSRILFPTMLPTDIPPWDLAMAATEMVSCGMLVLMPMND